MSHWEVGRKSSQLGCSRSGETGPTIREDRAGVDTITSTSGANETATGVCLGFRTGASDTVALSNRSGVEVVPEDVIDRPVTGALSNRPGVEVVPDNGIDRPVTSALSNQPGVEVVPDNVSWLNGPLS